MAFCCNARIEQAHEEMSLCLLKCWYLCIIIIMEPDSCICSRQDLLSRNNLHDVTCNDLFTSLVARLLHRWLRGKGCMQTLISQPHLLHRLLLRGLVYLNLQECFLSERPSRPSHRDRCPVRLPRRGGRGGGRLSLHPTSFSVQYVQVDMLELCRRLDSSIVIIAGSSSRVSRRGCSVQHLGKFGMER